MTTLNELAFKIIDKDEGFREKPYYCSEGYPTIGHGFRISGLGRHDPLPDIKMSLSESTGKLNKMLENYQSTLSGNPDLSRAYNPANDVRKAVMLSMYHQLGVYGLLKFKKFLAAMASQDYKEAAKQCLESIAARQTPKRWKRNAQMIESGELHAYYS